MFTRVFLDECMGLVIEVDCDSHLRFFIGDLDSELEADGAQESI